MPNISLVSCNIERSKNLERVVPFLREQRSDVVCIQECMEHDIPLLQKVAGEHFLFSRLCIFAGRSTEEPGMYGQAIFSRFPFADSATHYYAGEYEPFSYFSEDKLASIIRLAKAVTYARIQKEGVDFRIANTHFTWSENGEVSELQRSDLKKLDKVLSAMPDVVLVGDFNAPRGGEIFDALAAKYKDNIPARYTTSIDGSLHRAGALELMVDGLFSTPEYAVSDVVLHSGVSDHCAITANVRRLS